MEQSRKRNQEKSEKKAFIVQPPQSHPKGETRLQRRGGGRETSCGVQVEGTRAIKRKGEAGQVQKKGSKEKKRGKRREESQRERKDETRMM